MNRRSLLRQLSGGALAAAAYPLGRAASAQVAKGERSPNVILCMADDQGWGDAGYNGHPYLQTPHLDAMCANGLRFDRFYAGAPVCSPTRGSALTGRHPFRYGIYFANVGFMKQEEVTLAEALKTLGYTTGHFGKWHLGTLTKEIKDGRRGGPGTKAYSPPWANGFDECFSNEQAVPTWSPMEDQPFLTKYWTGPGEYATENLQGDDSRVIMDRAIPFVRRAAGDGKPFFAVIWFHAPHAPVKAGARYRKMYSEFSEGEQNYYGCLTALDEQVGRLRKELRELGIADNTMLWYCSDNGPEGKTHHDRNFRGSAGGLRGRKRSLFEGGVRVPGILEWPSRVKPGRTTSVPCSTSDCFPTVLAALDLDLQGRPEPVDGVNLMPLIEERMQQRPRPIAFQTTDNGEQGKAQRLGSPDHALIGNRYKFLSYLDDARADEDMLFDIAIDPGERTNLISALPEVAESMKQTLQAWDASCAKSNRGEDYKPE